MIFYKNIKKHKSANEKNLIFSIFENGVVSNVDDSVSKPAQCKSFYNLSYVDGSLKSGLGFQDLRVPASEDNLENCHTFNFGQKVDEICDMWMSRWFNSSYDQYVYQLFMIDSKFVMWSVPMIDEYNGNIWSRSTKLSSNPTYQKDYRIDNDDCCVFFSPSGMLYIGTRAENLYTNVPALISCVVHYDTFFGITNTERNKLIYTKNLNIKNWSDDEGSAIEFLDNRGSFTKLVGFNDYIYLFREYGITKISIYTTKGDFSFTHLYTSSSKIFEESVCVCGDKVFFMTRDGLYTFNGNTVVKVAEQYDTYFKNLDNSKCSAACLDGKYYIATKCHFDDDEKVGCENEEFVNNVLFEVDINNYSLNLYRGVDIRKLVTADNPFMSKLCACFNHSNTQRIGELVYSGSTFENSNKKSWKSFTTDLDYKAKRKRIKEIIINTLHPITIQIKSDEETKNFLFQGSEKEQRRTVSVVGKVFQFTFSTNEACCDVKKPMIIFDVEK